MIKRNLSTKANREYWKKADEALEKVNKWPTWKRAINIGSKLKTQN